MSATDRTDTERLDQTASLFDSIPMRIKSLRKRQGISQAVMARLLGVTQGAVSGWEQGAFLPSPMALMSIGRLDDDATWWYEQAGPQFADRFKAFQGGASMSATDRTDTERLDWLADHEANLRSHREKLGGGYSIWWAVVKRQKSISGHPLASPRAAIDAAMDAAKASR